MRQRENPLPFAPVVSIVVPAYETPRDYLCALIASVQAQSYPHWELCIADGSETDAVERTAADYAGRDSRIRYIRLSENGGISENTNRGLAAAQGSYLALMDHDDLITPNALYEMVLCLNEAYEEEERALALIYSDEDKISSDGSVHSRPHFKPDFNLEFLRHNNYICHFLLFSRELLKKAGGFLKEYDGAQDYDFVLRCVDAGAVVRHVPKILYHWRIHEGSTAGNSGDKPYAFDKGCSAIEAHLKRRGTAGRVTVTEDLGVYRVSYELKGNYSLTILFSTLDQLISLRSYYGMVYTGEGYRLEIEYASLNAPWFSMDRFCKGDYVLFIDDRIKVKLEGLVEKLLSVCQQKENGIVSAKLLTPFRSVAACGMIYNSSGKLIPACGGIPAAFKGYFLHAAIPQNVSAVPFYCVIFRLPEYFRVGGFDERLSGLGQDAALSFEFAEIGLATVVTPEVTAVFSGSFRREEGKREWFQRIWRKKLSMPDPCYNRNLSLKPRHTYAMKQEGE